MANGGRLYGNRITLNPPPDSADGGEIDLYAVADDPSGVLSANAGDRAFQIGTNRTWACTGGTVWEEIVGGGGTLPIIVRPAAPDPTAGVYETFAEAHAAAVEQVTTNLLPVTIYIDEFDNGIDVAAGTYDFMGLISIGSYDPARQFYLNTYDGVVFQNFQLGFQNGELYHDSADPLVTIENLAYTPYYRVGPLGGFLSLGAGPVYQINTDTRLILLDQSYTMGGDSIAVGNGALLVVQTGSGASFAADTAASADVTTALQIEYLAPGFYYAQTNFLGTITRSGQYPQPAYAPIPPVVNAATSLFNTPTAYRMVFGTLTLAATGGNDASISWEVEDGEGVGTYTPVLTFVKYAGDLEEDSYTYSFVVVAGRRYRWTRGGAGGVVEALATYNYVDSSSI